MTKDYFCFLSHKPEECFRQVLEKENRLEFLEESGVTRSKTAKQKGTTKRPVHNLSPIVHIPQCHH